MNTIIKIVVNLLLITLMAVFAAVGVEIGFDLYGAGKKKVAKMIEERKAVE